MMDLITKLYGIQMKKGKDFYENIRLTWPQITRPFECSSTGRSLWQIANTLIPFFALLGVLYWSLQYSYFFTLGLSLVTAGFWLRIFVLFHDCCHGSFFSSRKANDIFGFILGVLVFTPYAFWKKSHAFHHAHVGKLSQRGIGDVSTLTVEEYLSSSPWKKFLYRTYRNPLVQFVFGPIIFFGVSYRFSKKYAKTWKKEKRHIYLTNICLFIIFVLLVVLIGWAPLISLLIPTFMMTTGMGVWLFYIQHQFDYAYWSKDEDWSYVRAALEGSSYYKLPQWLHWFTGNIGFHHVHHLNPRIPNYRLSHCHRSDEIFAVSPTITFWSSLRLMFLSLWDEKQQKMISFAQLNRSFQA